MPSLALSDSFEYLCYGSTTIRNIFILTARGSTLDVRILRLQTSDSDDKRRLKSESDVYRRQILTTKVDPRAVRVNVLTVDLCLPDTVSNTI